MPYKSSRKRRSKPKGPGKFEIGAFCLVIGFAIGLTSGILMNRFARPAVSQSAMQEQQRVSTRQNQDYREERLQASMDRLKNSGKDVEVLKERYTPAQSGKVDKLNALLSTESGPLTIDDL